MYGEHVCFIQVKEIYLTFLLLRATNGLPRGPDTVITITEDEEVVIEYITNWRFACVAMVQLVRIGVGIGLGYAGILFLANTLDLSDLVCMGPWQLVLHC